MIDLSFLIPLVVIVVVMAKVSKEFSKVSRNRPTGGGSDDGTSGGGRVEGARSIAEFLEELKRQAQATQAAHHLVGRDGISAFRRDIEHGPGPHNDACRLGNVA